MLTGDMWYGRTGFQFVTDQKLHPDQTGRFRAEFFFPVLFELIGSRESLGLIGRRLDIDRPRKHQQSLAGRWFVTIDLFLNLEYRILVGIGRRKMTLKKSHSRS